MKTVLFAASVALVTGCSIVHQKYVEPESSGFYVAPKAVAGGFVVDAKFRDRYNALIGIYGDKRLDNGAPVFIPPLKRDDGVSDIGGDKWFMTREAMENMVILSDLKRRGAHP